MHNPGVMHNIIGCFTLQVDFHSLKRERAGGRENLSLMGWFPTAFIFQGMEICLYSVLSKHFFSK